MKNENSTITKLVEHNVNTSMSIEEKPQKDIEQIQLLNEYKNAVDQSTIISMTDKNGVIIYVNDAFKEVSGYSDDELIGKPHNIIRHPDTHSKNFKVMWETIRNKEPWQGILKNRAQDGSTYYVDTTISPILSSDGEIEKFIAIRHDITKVFEQEQIINRQLTDRLTGLPNRLQLLQDLEKKEHNALIIFDLDAFQEINKLYGQTIGDEILKSVAVSLSEALGKDKKQVYKLPGDVFGVLSIETCDEDACKEIIKPFFQKFSETLFQVGEHEIYLSMTAGVSYGNNTDILINANIALNNAKKDKLPFSFYNLTEEDEKSYDTNQKMIKTLKYAISNDKIVPYFQPIYNNKTLKIDKYEVLMRIINENGELISPFFFLEVSHKAKIYPELTKIIIAKAYEMFQDKDITFTINISIEDIRNAQTQTYIIDTLSRFNRPHNVVFEIVESEEIGDYTLIKEFVKEVKKYGSNIAIDDFGSGYSNFVHILELEPRSIKIDGSIIKKILYDQSSQILTQTIVSMAKKLNMKVIAEYVSSKEIHDAVIQLDIDHSQGYYFGEPKPFLVEVDEKAEAVSTVGSISALKEQNKIEHSLESLGVIVENSLNEVYLFDGDDFHFTYANKAGQRNLGYSMDELSRLTPIDIKPEHTMESFLKLYEPLKNDSVEYLFFNARHQRKDGSEYIAEIRLQKLNNNGKRQYVMIAHDITERIKIEKLSLKQKKQLEEAQKIAHLGSWEWDIKSNEIVWSDEVFRIFGEEPQSFTPTYDRFLSYLCKDGQDALKDSLANAINNKEPYIFKHEVHRKDGTIRYVQESGYIQLDDKGKAISMIGTVLDITKRHHLEEQLKKIAMKDSLTGICNRYSINKELDIEIERAKRYKSSFACVMLDIDHFKSINDTYGHDVGDDVLREFSTVISKQIRQSDRLGRWGGEEFILLLPELNKEQAVMFTQKLRKTIADHSFQDVSQITVSCGVTIFNKDDTKKSLLKRADTALYQAKNKGRNKVIFY